MGTLTLPINFLAHASDPPQPGDIARAVAAAELFGRRADRSTLGDGFDGSWADHDAPYVRHVRFDVPDPGLRAVIEELAHELAHYCWRSAAGQTVQ